MTTVSGKLRPTLVVLGFLLLAGCGNEGSPYLGFIEVKVIHTENNDRCVLVKAENGVSIDCDFANDNS